MAITYDPAKREWTLRERRLDFNDAAKVFAGWTLDIPDLRRDYRGAPHQYGRISAGPHGDHLLDAARKRPAHHFDEEGQ